MDTTEIIKPSRKSLARRVSFASHAHVRLFEKSKKNARKSQLEDEDDEEEEEEEWEEERQKKTTRRRSSTGFPTEPENFGEGEQSMELDEDDTAPMPQNFLDGPALDEEQPEFDDEGDYEDMDVTQAIPRQALGARKSSLGFGRESLASGRESLAGSSSGRRSSIVTSSQNLGENQPYQPRQLAVREEPDEDEDDDTQQFNRFDQENDTIRRARFADPEENNTVMTQSDMDVTTTSIDPTTSSNGDSTGQPMEFTIPILRPPPPPDEAWLKLRAMTHSGTEPYEEPEMEPLDDPEANVIVQSEPYWDEDGAQLKHHVLEARLGNESYQEEPSGEAKGGQEDGSLDESGMDLTVALSRLAKARSSLGLPPLQEGDTQSFSFAQDGMNDTFTSTEDSFGDVSLDGNQTLNLTKIRMSLGGAQNLGYDEPLPPPPSQQQQAAEQSNVEPPALPLQARTEETRSALPSSSVPPSVFSAGPSVFSAPAPKLTSLPQVVAPPPVFTLSTTPPQGNSTQSSSQSTPTPAPSTISAKPSQIPKSPAKQPLTVPKPFTFSVPSRITNDTPPKATPKPPSSPSKLPVFRGTAAFAPHTVPKSPRKRPVPEDLVTDLDVDAPSPAKKQVVEKLGETQPRPQPVPAQGEQNQNRRASASAARRPSGYFAQRRSLGPAASVPPFQTNPEASSLSKSISVPSVASQPVALQMASVDMNEDRATPQPAEDEQPERLYPDLSTIQEESTQKTNLTLPRTRTPSPDEVPSSNPASPSRKDKADGEEGKECEREARRQAIATPSPTRGSPSPFMVRAASPAHQQQQQQQQRRPSTLPAPRPSIFGQRRQSVAAPPLRPASPVVVPSADNVGIKEKEKAPTKTLSFAEEDEPVPTDRPMDIDGVEVTQQWLQGVEDNSESEEPTISIEQFFQMTGIRFMDEITAPRRSTIHPAHLRTRNRRRSLTSSHSEEAEPIALAEYMAAMSIEVPQLELYGVLSEDLTGWIDESKKICKQAEEDVLRMTPALFAEFALADEVEKQDLLHQLKIIKANCVGSAKSQWYDWKSEWVDRLLESAEEAFGGLESDAKFLEGITNEAQDILPSLRAEYAQVMEELEKEETAVAELEKSDKEYLNELKVSIAEQDTEIQSFKANVSEAETKLQRLQERLDEIEAQKKETNAAIAEAQRVIQVKTESNSSEVSRLKVELETLEDLHSWRVTKISPDLFEFLYATRYHVTVPCVNFRPEFDKTIVVQTAESKLKERDPFLAFTQLMIANARHVLMAQKGKTKLCSVVQPLGDFWSSCAQLRSQLTFLRIRFPLDVEAVPVEGAPSSLRASAMIMLPSAKSKAFVSFIFDWNTFSRWPLSIRGLKCDVEIAYGSAE
ncbi:uncharacterized protein PHACADRAFT_168096 [Phanerochaete carnosa HHB-10118-sp]|uniref:Spc7 kinetochore protein domain-containing protein n=1 Tax=Phanerochaete carnosa (strain HHB-10118-sp) TaxID=650164 RepID=K5WMV3_PHACS|nr:uncharacterized protein PHACADRAFT_168096 [Phanerochaete carnosa HHB-10118-sp]EKM60780.1 hypothetical protein PHACADRAFT_168096 [Phanerochaete carnosa HHB-10118-sp]